MADLTQGNYTTTTGTSVDPYANETPAQKAARLKAAIPQATATNYSAPETIVPNASNLANTSTSNIYNYSPVTGSTYGTSALNNMLGQTTPTISSPSKSIDVPTMRSNDALTMPSNWSGWAEIDAKAAAANAATPTATPSTVTVSGINASGQSTPAIPTITQPTPATPAIPTITPAASTYKPGSPSSQEIYDKMKSSGAIGWDVNAGDYVYATGDALLRQNNAFSGFGLPQNINGTPKDAVGFNNVTGEFIMSPSWISSNPGVAVPNLYYDSIGQGTREKVSEFEYKYIPDPNKYKAYDSVEQYRMKARNPYYDEATQAQIKTSLDLAIKQSQEAAAAKAALPFDPYATNVNVANQEEEAKRYKAGADMIKAGTYDLNKAIEARRNYINNFVPNTANKDWPDSYVDKVTGAAIDGETYRILKSNDYVVPDSEIGYYLNTKTGEKWQDQYYKTYDALYGPNATGIIPTNFIKGIGVTGINEKKSTPIALAAKLDTPKYATSGGNRYVQTIIDPNSGVAYQLTNGYWIPQSSQQEIRNNDYKYTELLNFKNETGLDPDTYVPSNGKRLETLTNGILGGIQMPDGRVYDARNAWLYNEVSRPGSKYYGQDRSLLYSTDLNRQQNYGVLTPEQKSKFYNTNFTTKVPDDLSYVEPKNGYTNYNISVMDFLNKFASANSSTG